MSPPILNWEGCLNARDVGGLAVVGGGSVKCVSLLRADSLCYLTPNGVEAVRRCGVSRIIDLRYPGEGGSGSAQSAPHPFAEEASGQAKPTPIRTRASQLYLSIPMFDPSVEDIDPMILGNGSTAEIYCASADHNGSRIAAAVSAIATAPPGPVLVHCAAGKDRTGIVVALALAVAGVAPQVIAADYAASAGHLASRFADELVAEPDPERRQVLQRRQATDPQTMLTLLDHLESRYGGAAAYLRFHGVDDDQLSALRHRLTAAA